MKVKQLVILFMVIGIFSAFAGDPEMPTPLKNSKVGDWVLYEMAGGTMQQKQTVTAVTEEHVTVKMETIMNGKTIATTEMKYPLKSPAQAGEAKGPKPKMTNEKVTIKGKEIDCVTIEMQGSKTWISGAVPINGMVKSEAGGNVTIKLVDFGKK